MSTFCNTFKLSTAWQCRLSIIHRLVPASTENLSVPAIHVLLQLQHVTDWLIGW